MESVYSKKSNCSGCGACYSACPVGAITMQPDEKGFLYPVINQEKCINCKKCQKVCPLNKEISEVVEQKVYAVKNKNEKVRMQSSSGGFFYTLAKEILENNGVVYGAVYDDELNVVHAAIDNMNDLNKLCGSKYVQSKTNDIYIDVQKKLKENKLVLFSGTPCQVYGLIKYLGKNYDNLLTCDNVCHGVPSPIIFDEHKQYLKKIYNSNIKKINFRYKNENNIQNLCVDFENGCTHLKLPKDDYYYFLFSKNFILRDSCYECHFSNTNRVSDITMGDFWGIEKVFTGYDDGKGVSLVIVNTEKGLDYYNKIKSKFHYKESTIKDCLQPNLISPSKKATGYDAFWNVYKKRGYISAVKKAKRLNFISRIKNKIRKILRLRG